MKHRVIVIVAALAAHAALAALAPAVANEALARKHICLACHMVDKKVVGPAYRDVAAKYKGKLTAAQLAKSIKAGGTGKWGSAVMPPQPAVSDADALTLASWILAGAPL